MSSHAASPSSAPNSLTFRGLCAVWWRARWRLLAWLGVGALLLAGSLAVTYFHRPLHEEVRLDFQLLFTGVDRSRYPNGTRFTPADIVAPHVLAQVHRQRGLEPLIPFETFRHAFAVLPANSALVEFRRDFRRRLGNPGLNSVERARLEDEYAARLIALRNGRFTLISRPEADWPADLPTALLGDILGAWMEQTRNHGGFRFDLDIYSPALVASRSWAGEDHIVIVERLRAALNRVEDNLGRLETIPGVAQFRVGPQQVSLAELRSRVESDLHYRLNALEVPVQELGLHRNRGFALAYATEQLGALERRSRQARATGQAADRALATYAASQPVGRAPAGATGGGLIPQLSDTILTQLLEKSGTQDDVSFRQNLAEQIRLAGSSVADIERESHTYRNLLRQLSLDDDATMARRAARQEAWLRQAGVLWDLMAATLAETHELYGQVSRQNLESAEVFGITEPARARTVTTVNLPGLARMLAFLGAMYAAGVLALTGAAGLRREGGRT